MKAKAKPKAKPLFPQLPKLPDVTPENVRSKRFIPSEMKPQSKPVVVIDVPDEIRIPFSSNQLADLLDEWKEFWFPQIGQLNHPTIDKFLKTNGCIKECKLNGKT